MANRLHQPHVPLPEIHWSPNEQWVWRKLRRGEFADFNQRYGVCPIPWEEEAWNEEEKTRRLIRPEFLYTVLLHEPWRGALSNWGVRLKGAYFAESIEMPHAEVAHEFWLVGCRVEDGLLLYDARFAHRLVMWGCCVNEFANLNRLHVGDNLVFDGSRMCRTDLNGVYLSGDFSAHQAVFADKLAMDRAQIHGGLFVSKGRIKNVMRLVGAQIDGEINLDEACIANELILDGLKTKGDLFMRKGNYEGDVRLIGIRVGGQVDMDEAFFGRQLTVDCGEIENGMALSNGRFEGDVRLLSVKVNGQLEMNESCLAGLLLIQRAIVRDALLLRWIECAKNSSTRIISTNSGANFFFEGARFQSLDLTGSNTQAIVDILTEWPDKLKLDHFTYQHLGGMGEAWGQDHMLDRPASWFTGWLAKHKPYSPQPYEQCAKVLQEAGQPGKAMEILYQAKERERNEPNGDFRRWVWLTASKWLLGHGLTWRFALVPAAWAVGVLLLGWLVFCQTTTLMEDHSAWWGLGYSLSKLIPLVSFGKDISELGVSSFAARAWFTFQTLFGWFLASLIVAGLAGVGRPGGKS